jgi:hypothetical protein
MDVGNLTNRCGKAPLVLRAEHGKVWGGRLPQRVDHVGPQTQLGGRQLAGLDRWSARTAVHRGNLPRAHLLDKLMHLPAETVCQLTTGP